MRVSRDVAPDKFHAAAPPKTENATPVVWPGAVEHPHGTRHVASLEVGCAVLRLEGEDQPLRFVLSPC